MLSQSSTVCEAYTNCPSVNAVDGSSKLPLVGASYHWILSPVAVKSATVAVSQNNCSASPVGAAGAVTFIVMYSLHVTPLVVTSTQYSVVSDGLTIILPVVSPVDQTASPLIQLIVSKSSKLREPELSP